MIFPHVRLWKWSIDQVVRGSIFSLQEELGAELVARFQFQNLRIGKLHRVNILGKVCFIIVPKDELAGFTRKLSIQLFDYLIQI